MEEKKRIDRLFQEKLKDFEQLPQDHVWEQIEQRLMKKKRKRILPLWLRYGSAAAILLLLVSTGFWYFNEEDTLPAPNTTIPVITDTKEQEKPLKTTSESKEVLTTQERQENATVQRKGIVTKTSNNRSKETYKSSKNSADKINTANTLTENIDRQEIAKNNDEDEKDNTQSKNIKNKEFLTDETEVIASNEKSENKDFQITKEDIAEAIEDQLPDEKESDRKDRKWSVGTAIAPIYFNSLSEGSPINTTLAGNTKETDASLSYGVKVNYHINDRLSLQSGINNVELAYNTQGVTALIASSELQFSGTNIDTNINGVNLIAISNNEVAAQTSELSAQRGVVNLRGDLNQSLNYIEIPMEAKYALLNKKVGVHVVGGFSTYVLYGNKITLLDQNGSTTLGEASNINDINFSGNLGLDLDYKLNKKLFINVSPMFKYQMNTFSRNDGGFQPYYLGVYTGLNFRF